MRCPIDRSNRREAILGVAIRIANLSQVGFLGDATRSLVGRLVVHAGRVVRRYDRRLGDEKGA